MSVLFTINLASHHTLHQGRDNGRERCLAVPVNGSAATGRRFPSCEPRWLLAVPASPLVAVADTFQPESPSETQVPWKGTGEGRGRREEGRENRREE